jgi:single-strand DNA-binding protein
MNQVILMGRLTRDPDLKTVKDSTVCNFSIAVDRKFKSASGERQADFINCIAWRQTGEFIGKYFNKGSMILLTGSMQTSTWEKDGVKQYKTEVVVDQAEFTGEKKEHKNDTRNDGFVKHEQETLLPFDV